MNGNIGKKRLDTFFCTRIFYYRSHHSRARTAWPKKGPMRCQLYKSKENEHPFLLDEVSVCRSGYCASIKCQTPHRRAHTSRDITHCCRSRRRWLVDDIHSLSLSPYGEDVLMWCEMQRCAQWMRRQRRKCTEKRCISSEFHDRKIEKWMSIFFFIHWESIWLSVYIANKLPHTRQFLFVFFSCTLDILRNNSCRMLFSGFLIFVC